jgi:hypothetical protein
MFTADGPERLIHLSQGHAEELVRQTRSLPNATVRSHEILIGRALGRALAHEMGHYLLESKVPHSARPDAAVRRGEDFLALSRDGFELTPDQWSAAVRSLQVICLPLHVHD